MQTPFLAYSVAAQAATQDFPSLAMNWPLAQLLQAVASQELQLAK